MARLKAEGVDKIYEAARVFREQALQAEGSILTPGEAIWTDGGLEEVHERFTVNWDGSADSFEGKLKKQMEGADDAVIQLMAEILLVHLLIHIRIGGNSKRQLLNTVLGWMKNPIQIPADVDAALDHGIAWPGIFFNLGRDRQLRFLIEWARSWKALEPSVRETTLADPWGFKEQLFSVDAHGGWLQRSSVLHLVFPDTFERIMLRADKDAVSEAFADRIGGMERARSLDEDRALEEIRAALSVDFGPDFDFYSTPEVEVLWRKKKRDMEAPIPLLERILVAYPGWTGFSDPRFLKDETNYKMAAYEKAQELLNANELTKLIEAGDFDEVVHRVERVAQSTNLLYLAIPKEGDLALLKRQDLDLAEFASALYDLLHGEGTSAECLGRFAEFTTSRNLPGKWALPTYLLMLMNPEGDFFVKPRATKWLVKELGAEIEIGAHASGDTYQQLLDLLGGLKEALADFQPQGMLDIQSYVWVAFRTPVPDSEQPAPISEGTSIVENASVYDHIAEQGFHFPDWLVTDYVLSLATKPLVILSGISGTGKTKMAQLVAEHVAPQVMTPVARTAPEADESSVLHQAKRVLLEHFYVQIGSRQVDLFPLPERGGGLDVELRVPGAGTMPGRLQSVGSTTYDNIILRLYLKGPARDWVRGQFKRGDYIRLTPESPESNVIGVEHIPVDTVDTPTTSQRIAFLSVRPDWTDNRALLGYYNPLTQKYQSTELLRLLLRAQANLDEPHFVILDEMNLAKVEYYFSDFLSAVEADSELVLHDAGEELLLEALDGVGVPQRLKVPSNVFFTGTVNVDETTYMFSPKVLDRANTLEFNEVDLDTYGSAGGASAGSYRLRSGASVESLLAAYRKPTPQDWRELPAPYAQRLRALHGLMAEHNLHFGYRVANEIARYLNLAAQFVGPDALETAYDLQVLQKVLPKLSGSRAKLEPPLTALLAHLADEDLPLSAAKVGRMLRTVQSVGFVSFVE